MRRIVTLVLEVMPEFKMSALLMDLLATQLEGTIDRSVFLLWNDSPFCALSASIERRMCTDVTASKPCTLGLRKAPRSMVCTVIRLRSKRVNTSKLQLFTGRSLA